MRRPDRGPAGKAVAPSYESWQRQRFAMALLKRVRQGQADAAAERTIPHEQAMAEVRARIQAHVDAKAATELKKTPTK